MKSCPDCESKNIIKNAVAIDRGHMNQNVGFKIGVDQFPDAVLFKERALSEVDCDVCGDCGFIQFYATNPQLLWETYQKRVTDVS